MAGQHRQVRGEKTGAAAAPYASRIIKGGALLTDTKAILGHWDVDLPARQNLDRIRQENLLGKASRSRLEDVLAGFRQRYLAEDEVTKALLVLVQRRFPGASLDRILYFHTARADRLLHDVVTEVIAPTRTSGLTDIDVVKVEQVLKRWVREGKTRGTWSEPTVRRIAQGLLSALRDFGVLSGAANKRIAPAHVPVEAFSYIAFYLKQHQPSGAKLLDLSDWGLFFLSRDDVEHLFFEAHQKHLLEYHAAGTVTRLTFPVATLEEYAHVLAERTH